MSPGKDQEYFSDGLSEELLNVLARIPELRVAGRTSSFQFKGKNEDPRVIGQKLNVATLLEGSVRKAGNRVRITAQLVKVADGFHLWSETYDRELTDIFAVQDEIARSVSARLEGDAAGQGRAGPSARAATPRPTTSTSRASISSRDARRKTWRRRSATTSRRCDSNPATPSPGWVCRGARRAGEPGLRPVDEGL